MVEINGTDHDDTLQGTQDNDTIYGGNGNDNINGGGGNDTIYGGNGDDTIDGNEGNDTMYGGSGNDTFIVNPGQGDDTIDGGYGSNTVQFNDQQSNYSITEEGEYTEYTHISGQKTRIKNIQNIEFGQAPVATACFTEDAVVKTDQGLLLIKDITTIHTINNKKIMGISKTISSLNKLVAIEKNAFGINKPNKKILVAPFHRFLIEGDLKEAVKLVNNDSIYFTKYKKQTLYNVIVETQETIEVNNIIAETLDPNSLVAKLFDGSMSKDLRSKVVKSLNSYHKNLTNKPKKILKDYKDTFNRYIYNIFFYIKIIYGCICTFR